MRNLNSLAYSVLPNGHVLVSRVSPLTGAINKMEIPINEDTLALLQ